MLGPRPNLFLSSTLLLGLQLLLREFFNLPLIRLSESIQKEPYFCCLFLFSRNLHSLYQSQHESCYNYCSQFMQWHWQVVNHFAQGRNFGLKSEGYQFRKRMGPEAKREENGLNREKVSPPHPTMGVVVSSPSGVWGEPPAENGFIVI